MTGSASELARRLGDHAEAVCQLGGRNGHDRLPSRRSRAVGDADQCVAVEERS
jgi:hypothetical protein